MVTPVTIDTVCPMAGTSRTVMPANQVVLASTQPARATARFHSSGPATMTATSAAATM
jgi:hypothetical protein